MENNKSKNRVEDYLTSEQWVEERNITQQSSGYSDDEDLKLANDMVNTIASQKQTLSRDEKKKLGQRISKSIKREKYKIIAFRVGAAAVLLALMGIASLFTQQPTLEIAEFAQKSSSKVFDGDTRLILSGNKEITIKSTESKIAYAPNSKAIVVDSTLVNQSVDAKKVIYNTVIVPYGKRTHITLSDNSSVWLNSGSKLIYPACFAENNREVYLEGEAIFEVSHNKLRPFRVVTHDVEVKVLGTVFDLSAYSDEKNTSTILESGSVEMTNHSGSVFSSSRVTMVPGTMAVYNPDEKEIKQSKVNVKLYTSWKDGYIACEKQSLGDILKKISRYYNVSIQLNDQSLANETFTGNLDLRKSASQVLAIIAEFINIKIDETDKQLYITRI